LDEFAWKAQEPEIAVGIFSYAGLKGACILYSTLLRDLLMKLAKAELWLDRQTTAMICRFVKSSRTAGTLRPGVQYEVENGRSVFGNLESATPSADCIRTKTVYRGHREPRPPGRADIGSSIIQRVMPTKAGINAYFLLWILVFAGGRRLATYSPMYLFNLVLGESGLWP
jgi:hypothetical protein